MCNCFKAAGVSTQIDQSTKSFGYSASALLILQIIYVSFMFHYIMKAM